MQSIKDVFKLILKGFGLRSPEDNERKGFSPCCQQAGADQNTDFSNLIEAIKHRDKSKVFKLLGDQGSKVLYELVPQSKDSLFHYASLSGDVEILKILKNIYYQSEERHLTWIELINFKNSLEQTPLHWACTIENLAVVDFLRKEGADLNVDDSKGVTPLIMCCQYGNTSCATYLILNGVNVLACDREGDNSLHWALYKGYPELARLMVYSGLNPNQKDGFGQTPLHFACLSGNANCVQNLVEDDKVEINVYDKNNKTPLMLAAGRRETKIVNYLKHIILIRTFTLPYFSKLRSKVFGTPFNSFIPMVFFISCAMFWGNPYYFFVIRPLSIDDAYFFNLLFIIVQCLMWICFFLTNIKNPGLIPKNDSHYTALMHSNEPLDNFRNITIKDCHNSINKICHSCKSYRPMRARHCRTCDRCVNEMDHHCPYVGNCIGKNNRCWFLLFIVLMNIVTVIVSHLFYKVYMGNHLSFYPAALTCTLILLAIFLGFSISFFMFKQALSNLTLIETQRWKKYNYLQDDSGHFYNPFDKGFVNNFLVFCNMKSNDVSQ